MGSSPPLHDGTRDCGTFLLDFLGQYKPEDLVVHWSQDRPPASAEVQGLMEQAWTARLDQARQSGTILFDGPLCRLIRFETRRDKLELTLGPTGYKEFLGTNLTHPQLRYQHGEAIMADPLGVSAAARRRSGCAGGDDWGWAQARAAEPRRGMPTMNAPDASSLRPRYLLANGGSLLSDDNNAPRSGGGACPFVTSFAPPWGPPGPAKCSAALRPASYGAQDRITHYRPNRCERGCYARLRKPRHLANPTGTSPGTDDVSSFTPSVSIGGSFNYDTWFGYWFDPRNGEWTQLGQLHNAGRTFIAPGAGDWLLLVSQQNIVPEPASLGLLAIAGGGMLLRRRR